MKIMIISDSGPLCVNGVTRTLLNTIKNLKNLGWEVDFVYPELFPHIKASAFGDFSLCYNHGKILKERILKFDPDFIHISVEGPLGITARNFCISKNLKFTTAYHTKFPEYLNTRLKIPLNLTYKFLNWFHSKSSGVFVATESLQNLLISYGFKNNFVRWSRGVDTEIFKPYQNYVLEPYLLYVGRVSHEKNIKAFLDLHIDLKKVVVGDGPQLNQLKKDYPLVQFVGSKSGRELASYYSNAEAFVFPSKTDTFGLVVIEALSCGTPVAAYNVSGPGDIIKPQVGCVNSSLKVAVIQAIKKRDREKCRQFVLENYTWEKATQQFIGGLVPVKS